MPAGANSWIRYHFAHLRRWREYAESIARAARDVAPGSKVYVVGSVAEGMATAASDIDVLVVLVDEAWVEPRRNVKLAVEVMVRAMDCYGLPWDAPVEVHVVGYREAERYLRRGRAVAVEPS